MHRPTSEKVNKADELRVLQGAEKLVGEKLEQVHALGEKLECFEKELAQQREKNKQSERQIEELREKDKQSERQIEELREKDKRSERQIEELRDENSLKTSQLEQVDSKAFIVCSLLLCSAPNSISMSKERMHN